MTLRDYITGKLKAFGITEASLADLSFKGYALDANLNAEDEQMVGQALVSVLEEVMLAPRTSSVSESGFSLTWDFSDLGRYYLWLCKRFGITPNTDVTGAAGLSMLTDKTDLW